LLQTLRIISINQNFINWKPTIFYFRSTICVATCYWD